MYYLFNRLKLKKSFLWILVFILKLSIVIFDFKILVIDENVSKLECIKFEMLFLV